MHPNASKKNVPYSQGIRQMTSNWARNAPKMIADTKRIDLSNPASQNVVGRFAFVPQRLQPRLASANGMSESADFSKVTGDTRSQSRLEEEEDQKTSIGIVFHMLMLKNNYLKSSVCTYHTNNNRV